MGSRSAPTLSLAILAGAVLFQAQNLAVQTVGDIRTFGYQKFIILFHLWLALALIAEAALMLFSNRGKGILRVFFAITIVCSFAFVLYGRGSAEHVTAILGGLPYGISWRSAWMSQEAQVWVWIMAIFLGLALIIGTAQWVRAGDLKHDYMRRVARNTLALLAMTLVPLLSIPPGLWLNERDVQEAKSFINRLVPKLQDFAHANDGAYPPTLLHSVMEREMKQPLLLALFDFLAYETKGAYYVSRPQKFCFLIYNPGGTDFGYHSMTSEHGWKFTPYDGRSLEEIYAELCDDPIGFQERITRHLGLGADPNDPEKILEPSQLFKWQWKAPDIKKFPEFLPSPEQKEQFMRENFPYLYEREQKGR